MRNRKYLYKAIVWYTFSASKSSTVYYITSPGYSAAVGKAERIFHNKHPYWEKITSIKCTLLGLLYDAKN